jgi:hypothetical protein
MKIKRGAHTRSDRCRKDRLPKNAGRGTKRAAKERLPRFEMQYGRNSRYMSRVCGQASVEARDAKKPFYQHCRNFFFLFFFSKTEKRVYEINDITVDTGHLTFL